MGKVNKQKKQLENPIYLEAILSNNPDVLLFYYFSAPN